MCSVRWDCFLFSFFYHTFISLFAIFNRSIQFDFVAVVIVSCIHMNYSAVEIFYLFFLFNFFDKWKSMNRHKLKWFYWNEYLRFKVSRLFCYLFSTVFPALMLIIVLNLIKWFLSFNWSMIAIRK